MGSLEEKLEKVRILRIEGLTDEEIAESEGVSLDEIIKRNEYVGEMLRENILTYRTIGHTTSRTKIDHFEANYVLSYSEVLPVHPDFRNKGVSLDTLIKDTELSVRVKNSLSQAGIMTVRGLVQQSYQDLLYLRSFGARSLKEVKQFYAGEEFKKEKKIRSRTKDRIDWIKKLKDEGIEDAESIAKRIDCCVNTIRYYGSEYGIEFERRKKDFSSREQAIREGKTAAEIAESEGVRTWTIGLFIKSRKLHGVWIEAKKKRKEEERLEENVLESKRGRELLGEISSIVLAKSYKEADPSTVEGWAQRKAIEYISLKYGTPYNVDDLTCLFERYKTAQDNKEKLSLQELAKGTRFNFVIVSKVLKTVGLATMVRHPKKHSKREVKEIRERIFNACREGASSRDITYFLRGEVSQENFIATYNPKKLTEKISERRNSHLKTFGLKGKGPYHLTYWLASEIYESFDLGFNEGETIELLGTIHEVVEYTRKNRKKYSSQIRRILKALYPKKEFDKPYLQ